MPSEVLFGYVDFTNDGRPFYVGIGDTLRVNKVERNTKHKGISASHGHNREIQFSVSDRSIVQQWEVATIAELKTYHYDDPEGIGCNFTRGGEGNPGWVPSHETRAKWSIQRKGNTWGRGLRPSIRGKSKPWLSKMLKGRKRPDLSVIMRGKKRDHYDLSDETRYKLGATNRGKHLSEEHRKRISEAGKGRKVTEETRRKISKPRTPEQRENYRRSALKRWEKKRNDTSN